MCGETGARTYHKRYETAPTNSRPHAVHQPRFPRRLKAAGPLGWGSRIFDPRGGSHPESYGANRNLLIDGGARRPAVADRGVEFVVRRGRTRLALRALGAQVVHVLHRVAQLAQPLVGVLTDQADAPGERLASAAGHAGVDQGVEDQARSRIRSRVITGTAPRS